MKFKLPKINLSIQILLVFAATLVFGSSTPEIYKSFFYSVSQTLSTILMFVIPFIIFFCLFNSMAAQQGKAFRFVITLLVIVCVSNAIAILTAYPAGALGYSLIKVSYSPIDMPKLEPLWNFELPSLIRNDYALAAGLILGLFFSLFPNPRVIRFAETGSKYVLFFLKKMFIPVLPLFALGFILKMEHEGILGDVLWSYAPIMLIVVVTIVSYLVLMFGIAANFKVSDWVRYIKTCLPAGFLGFTTMSSLATMPVTLNCAEKNLNDPIMARAIIPATANIHTIGDSLTTPILAMGVCLTMGQSFPPIVAYLLFTLSFVATKFAIPGVPCGSILVVKPLLEQYLGFTPEMSAFISVIFILFDPILTAGNVMGNSALAIILSRLMKWSPRKRAEATPGLVEVGDTTSLQRD